MKGRVWISSATVLTLGIGLMATTLYFGRAPKASKREVPVAITNETESLQVVSSMIEKNRLIFTIKNTGDQPVIAFHFDLKANKNAGEQPVTTYRFDLKAKEGLTGDSTTMGEIVPGSQFSFVIPLNQLEQDAKAGLYKLNIAMALFANGSAEGNWAYAENYRDKIIEGAALAAPQIREAIAHVNESDISTVKKLSDDLKTLFTPPGKLNRWQQIGYENTVIRARGQVEIMLREQQSQEQQSPAKLEKRIIELRKSTERQAALARGIAEGRQIQ